MNKSKKNIVIIGGGNGSAITINAVKPYANKFNISAVISMSDSGGSSGRLRQELGVLPSGDILRAILAMSPYDYAVLKKIFHANRFIVPGKLQKHNLGNLFLAWAEKFGGNYAAALRALAEAVEAVGQAHPVTLETTDLQVGLSNGKILPSEEKIDRPGKERARIVSAWLKPQGKIFNKAKEALENADYILIGPGSLYTSIVAALLPNGVSSAIKKSKAELIYVMGNAYEGDGESGPNKMSEFVKELQSFLPRKIAAVIYNNHKLSAETKKIYQKRKWRTFQVDLENLKSYKIIAGDYERKGGGLCPEKLGKVLKERVFCY